MGDHMVSAGVQPFRAEAEEDYNRIKEELQDLFRRAEVMK